jgi:Rod binding domain-containing protein
MPNLSAPSATSASPLDATLFRPAGPRGEGEASDRARFASVLGRHAAAPGETPEAVARRSAESFVAIALVQPILKQLRDTSQAAPPFAPTQGQKQFQALADADLAQRLVHRAHFPLVDRLTGDLLKRARAEAPTDDTGTHDPAALPEVTP